MPTLQFYVDYFQAIAQRMFGEPGHFWQLEDLENYTDLNQVLRGSKQLKLPCLVLRPFEEQVKTDGDNPRTEWSGVVTILYPATAGNFSLINQARSQARVQCAEVLAYMWHDARRPRPGSAIPGLLNQEKITLLTSFEGSDEPVLQGAATGYSYDFQWHLGHPLPLPAWAQ